MEHSKAPFANGVDITIPSVARIYDHYLGGKNNYQADREAADKLVASAPSTKELALNNRRFLRRVVRFLAEEYGIRQFLDHGSGLPTEDNVHEVAQRADEQARVVYVDDDPIVLAYGRALLAENNNTAVIQADMRDTEGIFAHPAVERLIDTSEPVAALFVSVLHCIPDADGPKALLKRVADRLPSGSFLVICQLVSEDAALRQEMTDFMNEATEDGWGRVRQEKDVHDYFEGLEIVEPGLVEVSRWRPDSEVTEKQRTQEWIEFGGLARKP